MDDADAEKIKIYEQYSRGGFVEILFFKHFSWCD